MDPQPEVKIRYKCDKCPKDFASKEYLKYHIMLHDGKSKIKCDKCPREFKRKKELSFHQNEHLGVKPYSCDICIPPNIYSAISPYLLAKHKKEVHLNAPHYCPTCNRPYYSEVALLSHLKTH